MRFNFYANGFTEGEQASSKLAVAGSDRDLSWAQLRQEAERLCRIFTELKIPKGHPVILRGHKEAGFMAAILACVSCELPYVPLDTIVPLERVKKIKALTGSQVLIRFGERGDDPAFPIELDGKFDVQKKAGAEFGSQNTFWFPGDPLVYIIFTSGSTGEPKGVQITRQAICSYLDWMERDYGFTGEDVFINQAPFSFDLSVYEVMFSMHLGGGVILNSNAVAKNTAAFVQRVKQYKGTVWVSTPSFAYLFLLEPSFNGMHLQGLRTFLFCGEELPNRTAKKLLALFPGRRVLNTYGPTEATVSTTLVDIDEKVVAEHGTLPVGYPKYTCEILIENPEKDPSRPGEIIIAGDNVSIGYLKNPELSGEKFFMHKGRRAYRTGDFGYIRNGMLFFLGRQDDQVKLNGYRIELGDINAQLCQLENVEDAVCVPLRSGTAVKRIVAFVKLKKGGVTAGAKEQLMAELKKRLPEYMVPGDMRFVDEFPHSSNHKIDKKKLIEGYMNGQ
jgi:D-alanine--poly(phosphoribitol) ligase subunit 1